MITPALPRSRDESTDQAITAWALAARTGDPEAVEHFVRALHRDVRRYVTYLGADPQAADDLTQDTFLRALGSLHRFEGRSSARTWLLSIARRAVIDNLRYTAARPRVSDTDDWQSAAERAQPRGCPASTTGWPSPTCSRRSRTNAGRPSSSPSSSDCPTRTRPTSATAPWGPCAPGWPGPARR